MIHPNRKNAGFTLVELLIALFLGLFLIAGAIQIFLSSKLTYRELERVTELQESVGFTVDLLVREFRHVGLSDPLEYQGWTAEDGNDNSIIQVQQSHNCFGADEDPPITIEYRLEENDDGVWNLLCDDGTVPPPPMIKNITSMLAAPLRSATNCSSDGNLEDCNCANVDWGDIEDWSTAEDVVGMCVQMTFEPQADQIGATVVPQTIEFTVAFRNLVLQEYNNS